MTEKDDHIFQEIHLSPMTVEEINVMTKRARSLPPGGNQQKVLVEDGEDPWVFTFKDHYYYCTVDRNKKKILISRFSELKNMARAELKEVWPLRNELIPSYKEIWSPEVQMIDGVWYIYFALYNGGNGEERMYVLRGSTEDPLGDYTFIGKLEIPTDRWAIDGSVICNERGEKFFIWSGWEVDTNTRQNIYIARMSDPFTISSDRVCISTPEYEWEKNGYPYINEGPQALYNNGKIFIIYSASGSWTDDYCLGQLTYLGGDMLNPASWRKEKEPVFSKTETIFGPGHASFLKVGNKNIIIYHAARSSQAGWARQIRYKEFTWQEDGSPLFGMPE